MSDYILSIVLAFFGTVLLRLIFRLLELRSGASEAPVGNLVFDSPVPYASVSQILEHSTFLRHARFLVFRLLPVAFVGLTVFTIANHLLLNSLGARISAGLSLAIFAVLNEAFRIFRNNSRPLRAQLIYHVCVNLASLLVIWVAWLIADRFDLSKYLPRAENLRDNLWSALFAALLVVLYFRLTDTRPRAELPLSKPSEQHPQRPLPLNNYSEPDGGKRRFLLGRARKICTKYGREIDQVTIQTGQPSALVTAILIYEEMNRPKPIRVMENILVRIPGLTLTVGIAQTLSNRPLSDRESIRYMGQFFHSDSAFAHLSPLERVLYSYNPSDDYANEVRKIYDVIQQAIPSSSQ